VVIVPPGDNHPHRRPGSAAAMPDSEENDQR
jgi:hypothetical protein